MLMRDVRRNNCVPVVFEMLRRKDLERHQLYIFAFTVLSPEHRRSHLLSASRPQLRALLLLIAAIVLKQFPVSALVVAKLRRRKAFVKKNFGSWKKVKRLLAKRDREEWLKILLPLAPAVQAAAAYIYRSEV